MLFADPEPNEETSVTTQTLREAPTPPIAALSRFDAAPLRLQRDRLALSGVDASSSNIPRELAH